MQQALTLAILIAMVGAAAWTDVRARRIPNFITLPGVLAGLVVASLGGVGLMLTGLGAALGMLALGIVLFATRILGGGDVKLLVACAMLLGPERSVWALALTALCGGVLALVQAARAGVIIPVLLNCRELMVSWTVPGRSSATATATPIGAVSVPYGVAIALGSVGAWFL